MIAQWVKLIRNEGELSPETVKSLPDGMYEGEL
jgi:hypothetical protein